MSAGTLAFLVAIAAFVAVGLALLAAVLPYIQHIAEIAKVLG